VIEYLISVFLGSLTLHLPGAFMMPSIQYHKHWKQFGYGSRNLKI